MPLPNRMTGDSARHVARIIVMDDADKVLLVRYEDAESFDPDGEGPVTYWVPPGGALNKYESHRSAAARELHEETGQTPEIGPALWEGRITLRIEGKLVNQWERYFLARLPVSSPTVSNQSAEAIVEHRWWTLPELKRSSAQFFPKGLVKLLAPVIEGEISSAPLRI